MRHRYFSNMRTASKLTLSYTVAFVLAVIITNVVSLVILFSFVNLEIVSQSDGFDINL